MRRGKTLGLVVGTVAALVIAGCRQPATWVYRDIDYGVVRVPEGTPRYEAEAVQLAREAFPRGFSLVRVEQVVVGDLKVENITKRGEQLDGALASPIDLLTVKGLTAHRERSTDAVETTKAYEVRYIFRNLAPNTLSRLGIAYDPDPAVDLAMYSDPLRGLRSRDLPTQLAQKSDKPQPDPQVRTATTSETATKPAPAR